MEIGDDELHYLLFCKRYSIAREWLLSTHFPNKDETNRYGQSTTFLKYWSTQTTSLLGTLFELDITVKFIFCYLYSLAAYMSYIITDNSSTARLQTACDEKQWI